MPYYRSVGAVPAKRHTQFRQPDGSLYAEELMGHEGFSSESALLYHRFPPTMLDEVRAVEAPPVERLANHPLRPHLLHGARLATGGDAVLGRRVLLANDDVAIGVARPERASPLYRNADGDEVVFVMEGAARLESVFGAIDATKGDYVVVPQSTTHRWVPVAAERPFLLVVEARGHLVPPTRYLSARGQYLEHAPYCERDLHGPGEPLVVDDEPAEVLVRRSGLLTAYRYAHHPFDVVGWDGCLYPHRFNIADFEPITGRVHQPPPVHQTFAGPGFVVCSFVPRLFDYHPLSIPAPYNHANTDSDEVLVYVDGDFMSRRGVPIERGSLTLHPSGFVHGPQPGSVEASIGAARTDEVAVMIDTFAPLSLTRWALEVSDPGYVRSWNPPRP